MKYESEHRPPWERSEGETSRAYALFCAYRDLGTERSLPKLGASAKGVPSVARLKVLCKRRNWVERARLYDDHLEREKRKKAEKEREAMNTRHANIAVLAQNVLVKGLEDLLRQVQGGKKKITAADIARLLDTSVKVERLARGESTEKVDNTVSGKEGGAPIRLNVGHEVSRAIARGIGALPEEGNPDEGERV